ncbi:MAG: hypothetical protein ABFS03_00715 [Chloroflexota bacterium]
MNEKEFNQYCCDVMGWEFKIGTLRGSYFAFKDDGWTEINLYNDLNQMIPVVEKLLKSSPNRDINQIGLDLRNGVKPGFIKDAFRYYIESKAKQE